jgi:hypothetical protein
MDLPVHRAILYNALNRAERELHRKEGELLSAFHPLWLGNWLTDINQATAFFDAYEGHGRADPYDRWEKGEKWHYKLPEILKEKKYAEVWLDLVRAFWDDEWVVATTAPRYAKLPKSKAAPDSVQEIAGYYPLDHFDVTATYDESGKADSGERRELAAAAKTGMTWTASEGVFHYCLPRWLAPAFETDEGRRRSDMMSLQRLGHATHTLQDFFSHSNFVELMLLCAEETEVLDEDLALTLRKERTRPQGMFAAYHDNQNLKAPVMTTRFDLLDMMASMLHVYPDGLTETWNDLLAGGFDSEFGKRRQDPIFKLVVRTFRHHRDVRVRVLLKGSRLL